MKIVHEVNQLDFGGVEKIVRSIIKHDKKNQHTVCTYKDGKYRQKLEEVGANIVLLGEEELDIEADVVHIHTGGAPSALATQLDGEFPVVETIHSPCRSAVSDHLVTKRIGVCDAVSRLNKDCRTIYNGLECEELEGIASLNFVSARQAMGIPEGKLVIGRLGRLGTDKGLEDWLLTCYYLQQAGYDLVPVIVGDEARDCQGYRGKLKLMAASLPVNNLIWISNKVNVSEVLETMDIFLYPSPTEGFGLVIAEAIYNGCAVVGWKNEVNIEVFGGHMVMVDPEKGVFGLVQAVEKVINNAEFMNELQGSGREFIEGEYQAEKMSEEYQEVYNECCNKHSNGQDKTEEINVTSA